MAGGISLGAAPAGTKYGGAVSFHALRPKPSEPAADPFDPVSMSVRSLFHPIAKLKVWIDDQLAFELGGQPIDAFAATVASNQFNGVDLSLHPEHFLHDSHHYVTAFAVDMAGNSGSVHWWFHVRPICLSGIRFAFPPRLKEDKNLMALLSVFDAVDCLTRCRTLGKVKDGQLHDPRVMHADFLPLAFEDEGLVYPDFDEISIERRRRILANANAIHETRYTLPGLRFYISLLVDATVDITKLSSGLTIFPSSLPLGLPSAAMVATSGSAQDICTYLFGPVQQLVVIKIVGQVPEATKQFIRETIYREIPMSDDPVSPLKVVVVFEP